MRQIQAQDTIGRLINNCFKGRDVAGRVGGDEFGVYP